MARIVSFCCNNLNHKGFIDEASGDDITTEITIGAAPVALLSAVDPNRKIIRIYSIQYSNPLALVWIRHGDSGSNFSFPLPLRHLYENTSQATRSLSAFCTDGTALLRFTVVNKL